MTEVTSVGTEIREQPQNPFGELLFSFPFNNEEIQVRKLVGLERNEHQNDEFSEVSIINEHGQRVAFIDATWKYTSDGKLLSITANNVYSNNAPIPSIKERVSSKNPVIEGQQAPIMKGASSRAIVELVDKYQVPLFSAPVTELMPDGLRQFRETIPNRYGFNGSDEPKVRANPIPDMMTGRFKVEPMPKRNFVS